MTSSDFFVDQRIDEIADRFENAWKSGQTPSIAEFIAAVPEKHRVRLWAELDAIDRAYRGQRSDPEYSEGPRQPAPESTRMGSENKSLARFVVQSRLGSGGFGTVYKAWDPHLQRTVALKLPRSDLLDPAEERRFLEEARSGAALHHPGIVAVHEVGYDGESPYIVCDYIDGHTLNWLLQNRPLSIREAAALVRDVARALDYAHSMKVIHRDIKPSNIIVEPNGHPYIMDFGLARRERLGEGVTLDGEILGTPAYMSPEQALGKSAEVDARSDVYGLGAVLYELLTGEQPFRGNPRMVIHQVVNDPPRSVKRLNDRVPHDLATICQKAMQKLPTWRYPSASAMADDLDAFLAGRPISARATSRTQRLFLWSRRNPIVAALSVAVFILLVAGLVGAAVSTMTYARIANAQIRSNRLLEAEASRKLAQNGIEKLEGGNALGLLDLLSSIETVRSQPQELTSRLLLTSSWLEAIPSRLHTVVGHDCPVTAVAVSADGSVFATGDNRGHVRIWDSDTGRPLTSECQVSVPKSRLGIDVATLQFSHDGRSVFGRIGHSRFIDWNWKEDVIATASDFDADRHIEAHFEEGPGSLFALASDNTGEGRICRLERRQPVDSSEPEVLIDSIGVPSCTSCLAHRQLYAIGYVDGQLDLWDLKQKRKLWATRVPNVPIRLLAFDPQGRWVAAALQDFSVRVWNAAEGTSEQTLVRHNEDVKQLAFSPDGALLASASFDSTVRIAHLHEQRSRELVLRHDGPVLRLSFSPDSRWLATGGHDESVRVWDAAEGALAHGPMKHLGNISALAFHPTLPMVLSGSEDGTARWWLLRERTSAKKILTHAHRVWSVDFSKDGKQLASTTEDGAMTVWDIPNEQRVFQVSAAPNTMVGARFVPGRGQLVCAYVGHSAIELWSLVSQATPVRLCVAPENFRPLRVSPDGRWIVAGSDGTYASIIELNRETSGATDAGGYWHVTHLPHPRAVQDVAIHPGGAYMVTACDDGNLRVWDLGTKKCLRELPAHKDSVTALAMNGDGTSLTSAGRDSLIRRWDTSNWTSAESLVHLETYANAMAFSNDGRLLAVALPDGQVRLIDPLTGLNCGQPMKHDAFAACVEFSPDGTTLASGGMDKMVRFWTVPNPKKVADFDELRRRVETAVGASRDDTGTDVALSWREWQANFKSSRANPAKIKNAEHGSTLIRANRIKRRNRPRTELESNGSASLIRLSARISGH